MSRTRNVRLAIALLFTAVLTSLYVIPAFSIKWTEGQIRKHYLETGDWPTDIRELPPEILSGKVRQIHLVSQNGQEATFEVEGLNGFLVFRRYHLTISKIKS